MERVNRSVEYDSLAAMMLSVQESATLAEFDDIERPTAFTVYWARKEAIVKATEDGLRAGLARLGVSSPAEPARLQHWPDRPNLVGNTQLHDLTIKPGYAAAVAILTSQPVPVRELDAASLLA